MKTRAELKNLALEDLRGNWKEIVLTTLVFFVICGACSCIPKAGSLLSIFVSWPIGFAYCAIMLGFVHGEKTNLVGKLFDGFKNYGRSWGTCGLVFLYVFLWSLLLIVPGIIKGLEYSMTVFIANERPELSIKECMAESSKMMNGHKWELFVLELSFIGWCLLATLTLGIGYFWLLPYMTATLVHYYEELKGEVAPATETAEN